MSVDPKKVAAGIAAMKVLLGLPPGPPKPKAVVNDGEVVRDANVRVSPADPNYRGSDEGFVRVRRSDYVTINMELYEAQQRQKAEDRRQRRMLDPYRLGHWNEPD